VHHLRIFANGPNGGNLLPVVVDATGMKNKDMQAVAISSGHESGFVFLGPADSDVDFEFRFWVPEHEMEMCGHATVGAVWLLKKLGRISGDYVRVSTKSGIVEARIETRGRETWVEISQEQGVVDKLMLSADIHAELLLTLGIRDSDLTSGYKIQISNTSRTKTIIPLLNVDVLHGLRPEFNQVANLCERIGSTGLYPYAVVGRKQDQVVSARQFPKNSGYNEDAATGIAAAVLAFALLRNGLVRTEGEITVKQGQAMGASSSIAVQFKKADNDNREVVGCWIGGIALLQ
jgi:PhzF family phenazine biosynthesis protein